MFSSIDAEIKTLRVILLALVVSFLFFFLNLTHSSVFFYLGLAGFVVAIFALSEKETFLLMSFLVPNLFMFKLIGSESAILGYFFALISVKTVLMNFKRNVKINWFFIVHIVFSLITCTLYSDTGLLISLVRFTLNFSLFTYYASLFTREEEVKQVVKMYCAGIITAILMGIAYRTDRGILYNGLFAGINSGRNYFGAVVTPTITIVILYFLERKVSLMEAILYGATIILCMISIVLSGSRTSALSLAIPIVLFLIYQFRSLWKFNRKFIPLLILIVIFGIIVYANYQDSILSLVDRFEEENVKTGNNRFDLWETYTKLVFSSPVTFIFGCGSIYDYSEYRHVEHNTIIQVFYQLGSVGFISFFGIVINAFRKIINGNKVVLISFFPLLSVIFPYLGISGLYADQVSYLLIMCALIMRDFSVEKT